MTDQDQEQQTQDEAQAPPTYSIYITGGTSPVGLALTQQLVEDGHTVACHAETAKQAGKLRELGALPMYGDLTQAGDIRNDLSLIEADVLVNLRPQTLNTLPYARRNWEAFGEQYKAEAEAALEAAAQAGVDYVVHTSLALLPDGATPEIPLLQAIAAAERKALEMGGCVMRVGYLYSDAPDDGLHELTGMLQRSMPLYQGKADGGASWTRTDELASALFAAVKKQPRSKLYHIVGDDAVSEHDFLRMFAEKTGYRVPAKMPNFAARRVYGNAHIDVMDADTAQSNADAKQDLDWQPKFASLDASLEDVLLTWRAGDQQRTIVQQ